MRKGERTRELILERAAELFNVQGYAGSSLSDIMQATGLQKGGIYNHFVNKENLALEAFDHAWEMVKGRMGEVLKVRREPVDRLLGIIQFFVDYHATPPVRGGCIVLNTAIESDDVDPLLRERARGAMDEWRNLIIRTIHKGIAQGVMHPDVQPDEVASLIISSLEGALMMSQLYGEKVHIERVANHLKRHVETDICIHSP